MVGWIDENIKIPAEFHQLYKERPCPIQPGHLQLLQELHPEKLRNPLAIR